MVIQVLRSASGGGGYSVGVGGIQFRLFQRYEGVQPNVISIMRRWVGVKSQKKALRNTGIAHNEDFVVDL